MVDRWQSVDEIAEYLGVAKDTMPRDNTGTMHNGGNSPSGGSSTGGGTGNGGN